MKKRPPARTPLVDKRRLVGEKGLHHVGATEDYSRNQIEFGTQAK
jgi:hypothetical protein